ncbi:MAG: ABC transporter substrate-binding protein [Acidovorax sp.]|uniref:ABC transporter substrate-binding protein n=1 Tax=Acidovorax sp. TaxID=1872122 RepID=UPI0039E6025F
MKRSIKPLLCGVCVGLAAASGAAAAPAADAAATPPTVEISSWWVSEGEAASLGVIRKHMQAQGLRWRQRIAAGSGTSRYGDVLKRWVAQGKPPMASQVIGYDIHEWARQGKLSILDDVAREQEWDEVVPYGIQHLSKYQGHWVAAPINAHSTNWLWVNHAQFARLDIAPPDTWDDLVAMLDRAKQAGVIPLAMGREAWEHTLLFESVAAGAGGAEFYRRAFLELDPAALDGPLPEKIFARMSVLRGYLDAGFSRRSWDEATTLVRQGKALAQVQGSWVLGEFRSHGLVAGQDFECLRFPDTQGLFLFNSDQYMLFKDGPGDDRTRAAFARTLMQVDLQAELNVATGAAPARVDVPRERFGPCGQRAISDMRGANMRRTLMGSIAMGNANPGPVKQAIYDVVRDHLMGRTSDAEAARRLRRAIAAAHTHKTP